MPNNHSAVNNFSLRIIHPVHEHSSDDLLAFKHALAIAHAACGEIEIIDVRDSHDVYESFSVRGVLEKWGILPPNSERQDVGKLGLKVTKIVRKGEMKKFVSHRMEKHPHDMLVIGTHERHGLGALFGQDLAEYLADAFRQTTLYVPAKTRPFINPETGVPSLKKVLIPIAVDPSPELSFSFLHMLLGIFHLDSVQVMGLHCGEAFPEPSTDLITGLYWKEILTNGAVVTAITEAAHSNSVDLIIMTTQGRNSLPKKIMGTITEHVLNTSPCPVLSIPVM
jgi:nucleotide-binding universal stress UspA family protein